MRGTAMFPGLLWVAIGFALLACWRKILNGVTITHEKTWGRIGVRVGSEKINRIVVRTIVTIVAVASILAGVESLYEAITGREFPLRTASWSRLWPY